MAAKGILRSSSPRRYAPDACPERSLAFAVIRQAWNEAVLDLDLVKESSRRDYVILKNSAIDWICGNSEGFLYWCQLADMNHTQVRQKLREILRSQDLFERNTYK